MKFRRKAELAAEKRAILKTGGGPPPVPVESHAVIDIIGNVDIEVKDTVDSDTARLLASVIEAGENIILEADPIKRKSTEIEASTSSTSATPRRQEERPRNLFTQEAGYRIEKVAYLNALEREIGEKRREEQEYRCKLVKQQFETAVKEDRYMTEKHELQIKFLKEKHVMEMEMLKRKINKNE